MKSDDPPQWIDRIMRKGSRWWPVYDDIKKNTLSRHDKTEFLRDKEIGKYRLTDRTGKHIQRDYAIFIPDYPRMQVKLGLSKRSTQDYLKGFCRNGWLVKLGKGSSRSNAFYAVGYWTEFRKVPFLKNTSENRL